MILVTVKLRKLSLDEDSLVYPSLWLINLLRMSITIEEDNLTIYGGLT